ncbi:MAG: hypothetical protein H6Q53_443 [Deltaproteobacteria bacterium]|nr:hypothetical protein [Deltaproteobacteria bacterium]
MCMYIPLCSSQQYIPYFIPRYLLFSFIVCLVDELRRITNCCLLFTCHFTDYRSRFHRIDEFNPSGMILHSLFFPSSPDSIASRTALCGDCPILMSPVEYSISSWDKMKEEGQNELFLFHQFKEKVYIALLTNPECLPYFLML